MGLGGPHDNNLVFSGGQIDRGRRVSDKISIDFDITIWSRGPGGPHLEFNKSSRTHQD